MTGMYVLIIVGAIICACDGLIRVEAPHDEMFRYTDSDNDNRLTHKECRDFWLNFDADGDHLIGKLEFELKWTFLDMNQSSHAAFFYKQLDNNMDGRVDNHEINRMCNYFDDDNNGHIDKMEFDMNWVGLFTFPTGS